MTNWTLLSIAEVAGRLGLSSSAVYRLVYAGKIPAHRIGGRLRFREAEIEAWLESTRIAPVETSRPIERSREEECAALGIPTSHRFN
jgi:excisionase family DNA binding protein